ncbi:hypothetical protein [Streptomyces sp. NEAU-174]|uniref:hypothetical protein n=1 Tax=Streptomyces sp. NEAU-174 TaxID=3458254 RepID=UPI004044E2D1
MPEALVCTRETASPGYQQALAAHQASRAEWILDSRTAAAIEQQNAGSSACELEEAWLRTAVAFARCGGPVLSSPTRPARVLAGHQSHTQDIVEFIINFCAA